MSFFEKMKRKKVTLFLIILLYVLSCPFSGFPLNTSTLKQEIKKNKQTLRTEKQVIKKLSKKEKRLYTQLAKIEARVQKITQELNLQEEELSTIKTNEALIVKKYQHLISEQKKHVNNLLKFYLRYGQFFYKIKVPTSINFKIGQRQTAILSG